MNYQFSDNFLNFSFLSQKQTHMKIKFKSDHLTNKAGDEIEVAEEQGKYFIAIGIAEEVKAKKVK